MHRNLLFLLLVACLHLLALKPIPTYSVTLDPAVLGRDPSVPFALFTVPKSGSHLLLKTLYFITGFTPEWHTTPPAIDALSKNRKFPYTHICLSPSLQAYYYHSLSIKQIIGVRDLRDVCVSIVFQIVKGPWPQFTNNKQKQEAFKKLSFDDQLLWVINQEYEPDPSIFLQLGIAKVAEQARQYGQNPEVFVCRFEDLIGAQGGGNEEKQHMTIRELGEHVGVFLRDQEIQAVASQLFGNEINPFGEGEFQNYQSTFREGKIGSWKSSFKEHHKQAFKKRLGPALIALGYEENDDW